MKKLSRRILLVMLLLFTALSLSADPNAPYSTDKMIYYNDLTKREKRLYDLLYNGVVVFEKKIDLPEGYTEDEIYRVVGIIRDDSPELSWLGHSWKHYYNQSTGLSVAVEMEYTMSLQEAKRREQAMVDFYNSLGIRRSDDDLRKELVIINALLEHTVYDLDAPHAHDTSGAMADGRAVCEGYSLSLALLLRLAGIPAGVVVGNAPGPHAWNIAYIEDEWTLIDATWNDDDRLSYYNWLNLSYDQFRETHREETYPKFYKRAGNTYELARIRGLYCSDSPKHFFWKQLKVLIEDDIPVDIYFETQKEMDHFEKNYQRWISEYNEENPGKGFYDGWRYNFDDKRRRFYMYRNED